MRKTSLKEPFGRFFRKYEELEKRILNLESVANNLVKEAEITKKIQVESAETSGLLQQQVLLLLDDHKTLFNNQTNIRDGLDQYIKSIRESIIKVKKDCDFALWLTIEGYKGDQKIITETIEKLEARVKAIEEIKQSHLKQTASSQPQIDPCEGKNCELSIKQLIQKVCEFRKNPNLSIKVFDLLTDEQKDLVPDTWDVLGGIYCLNKSIGHATLTDIRGRIQRFKSSDVRDVLKKLIRSGFVSQRQLTQAQWAGHRSDPPLTHDLTPYAHQIFFPQSKDNTGIVHVAIELEFFLQILQRPRPLLYVSIEQQPDVNRFDGAIFRRANSESFQWYGADAVNIETDEEVRAHPEQVLMNMITPFLWDIERVKMVCSKESEAILTDLKQQLPSWLSEHIDIVVVSIPTI